nr:hypothetical protein [uncultured Methanomethylovorans sp.]
MVAVSSGHTQGILEAMKNDPNNGVAEGLNDKIKTTLKRSFVIKAEKCRINMIYLLTGKLRLPTGC